MGDGVETTVGASTATPLSLGRLLLLLPKPNFFFLELVLVVLVVSCTGGKLLVIFGGVDGTAV